MNRLHPLRLESLKVHDEGERLQYNIQLTEIGTSRQHTLAANRAQQPQQYQAPCPARLRQIQHVVLVPTDPQDWGRRKWTSPNYS